MEMQEEAVVAEHGVFSYTAVEIEDKVSSEK